MYKFLPFFIFSAPELIAGILLYQYVWGFDIIRKTTLCSGLQKVDLHINKKFLTCIQMRIKYPLLAWLD